MTKTEIAKALRTIALHLTQEASLRTHSIEDSHAQEVLCEVAAATANEINSLILKFNAGKMPRKTPVRNKSTTVFYVESFTGNYSYEEEWQGWDEKPMKKKFKTVHGWQKDYDFMVRYYPESALDFKVFDNKKKLIARFRRDENGTITHNKGR